MRKRKEDKADKWLRENDPYYTALDTQKRKRIDRPYDTPDQEVRKRRMEIPVSSLSLKQRVEVPEIIKQYDY